MVRGQASLACSGGHGGERAHKYYVHGRVLCSHGGNQPVFFLRSSERSRARAHPHTCVPSAVSQRLGRSNGSSPGRGARGV
eukprot:11177981-Lingulodinium_polyedra.AAC.1